MEELEFFPIEKPEITPTPEAVSSEPEESDRKIFQEIISHVEPEITQSPKIVNFVDTPPSTQESQHHPAVNLRHEVSDGPQPELQPSPAEEKTVMPQLLKSLLQKWAPSPAMSNLKHQKKWLTFLTLLNQSQKHLALTTIYFATQRPANTRTT